MVYQEEVRIDQIENDGELTPEQRGEYTARIAELKRQMADVWNRSSDMSAESVHASDTQLRNLTSEILALYAALKNNEVIPTSLCLVPLEESIHEETLKIVGFYGDVIEPAIQEYNGLRVPINQTAENYKAFMERGVFPALFEHTKKGFVLRPPELVNDEELGGIRPKTHRELFSGNPTAYISGFLLDTSYMLYVRLPNASGVYAQGIIVVESLKGLSQVLKGKRTVSHDGREYMILFNEGKGLKLVYPNLSIRDERFEQLRVAQDVKAIDEAMQRVRNLRL